MADTTIPTELQVQQWDEKFFQEYIRDSRFKRYSGTSVNNIIVMNEELTGKPGQQVTIPLVTRLKGQGVTGSERLKGNEEKIATYGHKITTTTIRNGVTLDDEEEAKAPMALRSTMRPLLRNWIMEDLRGGSATAGRGIIDAMGSFRIGGSPIKYADATEGNKDTFLGNNLDRFLFGAALGNTSTTDHSASLANVDSTNDKLSAAIVSLSKRIAKDADPHIRPIIVKEDEEWYVMFSGSRSFRDLKEDSVMAQANREARARGVDNPIFRDGDLIYDGVIVREVPEIGVITGVGAASIDVSPNYLCGAQAVGIGWAMRTKTKTDTDDYGFSKGVAVQEMRGVEKLVFNDKQHGMVTVYTSGVADA